MPWGEREARLTRRCELADIPRARSSSRTFPAPARARGHSPRPLELVTAVDAAQRVAVRIVAVRSVAVRSVAVRSVAVRQRLASDG
jgi:hypothetical protein